MVGKTARWNKYQWSYFTSGSRKHLTI